MENPKYQPEQWVQFNQGANLRVAQIVGAKKNESDDWQYYVTNPAAPGTTQIVKENDINFVVK